MNEENKIPETAEQQEETAAGKKKSGGMKKLIIGLAGVCIIAGAVLAVQNSSKSTAETQGTAAVSVQAEAAPQTDESAVPEEEAAAEMEEFNFDEVYALHNPNDVVMTVNGEEVTWAEYGNFLYYNAAYLASMWQYYYGALPNWADELEEGLTFNQYAHDQAEAYVLQYYALEKYAEEKGIALTEEEEADVQAQLEDLRIQNCGEDSTREEFEAFLQENYLTYEMYEKMIRLTTLFSKLQPAIYGENDELVPEEEAIAWLENNGYMSSAHILLKTMDDNGNELAAETVEELQAKAEELAAELQAIEDIEARKEAFYTYMNELSEDGGKAYYTEGYVFTSGQMVPEFEQGTLALGDYEVSDPIKSTYGYHIIFRLPLRADGVITFDNTTPVSARNYVAQENISRALAEIISSAEIEYKDNTNTLNLADYA